eukprot:scpid69315/ scgid14752/ 
MAVLRRTRRTSFFLTYTMSSRGISNYVPLPSRYLSILCVLATVIYTTASPTLHGGNTGKEGPSTSRKGTGDTIANSPVSVMEGSVLSAEAILNQVNNAMLAEEATAKGHLHHRSSRQAFRETSQTHEQETRHGYKLETFHDERFYDDSGAELTYGLYFNVTGRLPKHIRIHYAVLTLLVHCRSGEETFYGRSENSTAPAIVRVRLLKEQSDSVIRAVPLHCPSSEAQWLRLVVTPFIEHWMKGNTEEPMCISSTPLLWPSTCLFLNHSERRAATLSIIYEVAEVSSCSYVDPILSSNEDVSDAAREQTCCRVPYYIDFKDTILGDDIVFPAGYNAYACQGWCPRSELRRHRRRKKSIIMPQSNAVKAEVMSWMSSVHPQCQPLSFAPVFIMVRHNQPYPEITHVPDSIVLSCGCKSG